LPRTSEVLIVLAVAGGGAASTLVDLRTRRVPNWLTFGLAATGLALAASQVGPLGIGGAVGGLVVGLLLMLPGHFIGATGAGDVKLFAAQGTLLGPSGMALAFLYTAIAGGALALLIAINRRRLRDTVERTAVLVSTGGANVAEIESSAADNRFAYAPAIALGTLAVALGL
jgi:prepilin peptidase CpaA